VFTGTGFNDASSTYVRLPSIARPIGGTPCPATNGRLIVATTLDSVGPYALIIRRPPAHRWTSSADVASPPTTNVRNPSTVCAGKLANAAGGTNACVGTPPPP
jgi:hypothetical protein